MRIAMIGPFGLSPKGTMRARALPLARALARQGHDVLVAMPPWHTPGEGPRTWKDANVEVAYVRTTPHWSPASQTAAVVRMVRLALAWRPDVIHCFKPKGHAGLSAWLLWSLRHLGVHRIPVIVDEDDWEGLGGWNEVEPYGRSLARFFAWQERWGLTHADAVTVASRALQTLVWSLGCRPERVVYVPNGPGIAPVDDASATGAAVRAKLGSGDIPVVLLYTRFFEYRVDRLIRVLSRIVTAMPATHVLVVGQGLHDADDKAFDDQVGAAALGDRVVRTGWVPMEAVPGYLAVADVALHLLDDTLVNRAKCSVKLVDLMHCGVAVVADDVGQNREYIRHGETGILVPPEDPDAMADATVALLNEPARRRAMGQRARQTILARYAWDSLAAIVLNAYTAALL